MPFKKGHTPHNKGKKGFKHKKETIRKMREDRKGKTNSGSFKKGNKPDKPFKKGHTPHNKGKKGFKQSAETVRRRVEKTRGQKRSEEQRRRISVGLKGKTKGRKQSAETIRKRVKKLIGHPVSAETREKLRIANTGKTMSIESRKKISEVQKGRKQKPETIKKRADANRGKKRSKEFSENLSKKLKGRTFTDETIRRMSVSAKIASNRPERIQKQREVRANQVFPSKDTKPERQIQGILTKAGIVFKKHPRIKYDNRYHQADILIRPNKLIEHNGIYHHADPRKYNPDDIITLHGKKIKASQVWKDEKLMLDKIRAIGYEILVVWQYDLKKNFAKEKNKILEFAHGYSDITTSTISS